MDETARERIERLAGERDGEPDPGWEAMEKVAREAAKQNEIPTGPDQANPNQSVPEDEQLQHPVATETDSY